MFVCGPTVYDYSHLGHAKTYTQFDMIARYLSHAGFNTTYLQNITDIDDKIIARAASSGVTPKDLAAEFEKYYLEDMRALGNDSVTTHARAHDYIEAIVSQVKRLIDHGNAYKLDDGWYFNLATFPQYGKLSKRTAALANDAVSRIDESTGKRNAGDFALWKFSKPGEPQWLTELGSGRPGWHIEDTAITETFFGPNYDLHGGAVDLIFPHHEAEIAQMESASCCGGDLAKYWMHTGFLNISGQKMSKSQDNFTTIRAALNTWNAKTLRYAFLSTHYRSGMELTSDILAAAEQARHRLESYARRLNRSVTGGGEALSSLREQFFERMDDDFDTSGALAVLFKHVRDHNRSGVGGSEEEYLFMEEVNSIFRFLDLSENQSESEEIDGLVRLRNVFRRDKRFADADKVRKDLEERGVTVEDTPTGESRWYRSEG